MFDDARGLIIRSSSGAFRIEPAHRSAVARVLAVLDGSRDYEQLLGHERTEDALYVLGVLESLAICDLLAEGPGPQGSIHRPRPGPVCLDGTVLVSPVDGSLADALSSALEGLGATVHRGDPNRAEALGARLLLCLDAPDLRRLEETNRTLHEAGVSWLPVMPFGDVIVIGPLIRPHSSPCFRCFELRWLGISPNVALELKYFAYLRSGGWRNEVVCTRDQARRLAELLSRPVGYHMLNHDARDDVVVVSPERGTSSTGTLLRHPGCNTCAQGLRGQKGGPPLTEAAWHDPPLPLARLARMVSRLQGVCGLAAVVADQRSEPRSVGLPEVVLTRFALPEPEEVDGDQDNFCHGAATCVEDARALAIVEAIERYSGLSPPTAGMWSSYHAVADRAILPTELPLFTAAQYAEPGFPFRPFDPAQPLNWTWGYNLTRRTPVLVPATAAWYGSDDQLLGETSSGVAAHTSRGCALLNGALELVERDAFMIHWLNRISPPLLDLDQVDDDQNRAMIENISLGGYEVRMADLTTDLAVPVYLAIGFRHDRRKPALVMGAGAALDGATALARSLREMCAASLATTGRWALKEPVEPDQVQHLEDHSRAYEHPDWLAHASFLWESAATASACRASRSAQYGISGLDELVILLRGRGHDLIGIDITGADVAEHHIRVVRAIIPGLQPLGFGRRVRLGGRRLFEAPVRMGYRKAPSGEGDLNRTPHCFP